MIMWGKGREGKGQVLALVLVLVLVLVGQAGRVALQGSPHLTLARSRRPDWHVRGTTGKVRVVIISS